MQAEPIVTPSKNFVAGFIMGLETSVHFLCRFNIDVFNIYHLMTMSIKLNSYDVSDHFTGLRKFFYLCTHLVNSVRLYCVDVFLMAAHLIFILLRSSLNCSQSAMQKIEMRVLHRSKNKSIKIPSSLNGFC